MRDARAQQGRAGGQHHLFQAFAAEIERLGVFAVAHAEHRELHARKQPLVGVCFGHQAVALALGGTVEKAAAGWGFGTAVTNYAEHRAWMVPPRRDLTLYASHSDQVTALPDGAKLLGGNDFCPNAAFEIGTHIMTTQYHPELTAEFMTTLLDLMDRKDMLPDDVVTRARDQLRWKEDGVLFAEWMVRFLESAA